MKKQPFIITLLLFFALLSFHPLSAQDAFQNCAMIKLDGKMLVKEYKVGLNCHVSIDQKGTLTVGELAPGSKDPKLRFQVAIRKAKFDTLIMYSAKDLKEVQLADLLAKCEVGDAIYVMTVEEAYSLPHHVIEVGE